MIRIGNIIISNNTFPDGTPAFKQDDIKAALSQFCDENGQITNPAINIVWHYENMAELFSIRCLKRHFESIYKFKMSLCMAYIPNARMDRVHSLDYDVFTLKYFCEEINSLNFDSVVVLDPHSDVSSALINNCIVIDAANFVTSAIDYIKEETSDDLILVYPDATAAKRYAHKFENKYIQGIKQRSWEEGKINDLKLVGDLDCVKDKNVLIVDDICCRGGTFMKSAEQLKELGAKDIYLYVSHCEHSMLDGDIPKTDLIKTVFTTNSIFNAELDKVMIAGVWGV